MQQAKNANGIYTRLIETIVVFIKKLIDSGYSL